MLAAHNDYAHGDHGPYTPTIVTTPVVPATEDSPAVPEQTTVETVMNMTPENRAHFESEKEVIHLILTGIGDEIYSTVDACQTAQEIGMPSKGLHQVNVQFLQQLQPEWSRFVTIVKQQHKLDEVSYHKLFDILKQYQKEVNELRAERMAKNANPLALVATAQTLQDPYYQTSKPHKSYAPTSKASLPTRSHATTRYKGKEIAKPIIPPSESASEEDSGPVVQQSGIQCFNCKEFGHYAKECRKPKRVKDSTYHKEKMLLCKQAEKGVQLQAKQSDWLADTDEEIDEQELEAHYSYMANESGVPMQTQELILSQWNRLSLRGPLAQKEIDIKEGLKVKAYEISVVKEKHDELVKQSLLTKSHYEGLVKEKTKVITDLKLKEEKDIDKMISMENQIKFLNEIVYKRSQSIQTIHMLAPKCPTFNGRPTFANPRYLKKAQNEIPCLYAIPHDQSDPANRLVPDREETQTLEEESRSKLNKDLVKPFDYTKLNSLYEIFKPPTQHYEIQFAQANEIRKKMWRKSFVKTKPNIFKNIDFLPVSKSISKSRQAYNVMTNNINHLKEIVNQAWVKHSNDLLHLRNPTAQDMEILVKTCLMPLALKTQNDSFAFVHELKQEMHADLKYVESLEDELDELESDKAEFSNMYDMLLQECVSKDVMCSYLQSSSDLDEITELQCLYLHKVRECDCLAQKLSEQTEFVSKEIYTELLRSFAKLEKHSISLEIALQECQEQLKNDTVYKEMASAENNTSGPVSQCSNDVCSHQFEPFKFKAGSKSCSLSKQDSYITLRVGITIPPSNSNAEDNRDGENLDKMKKKVIRHFCVDTPLSQKGLSFYIKRMRLIVESIHLMIIDEIKEMSKTSVANDTSGLIAEDGVPITTVSWESSFLVVLCTMKCFNDGTSRLDNRVVRSSTDNSAPQDTNPSTNIHPTSESTTPTNVHAEENNDNQAEFTNPFCTPVQEAAESSSRNFGSNARKTSITFDRLQVWELVDKLFGKNMDVKMVFPKWVHWKRGLCCTTTDSLIRSCQTKFTSNESSIVDRNKLREPWTSIHHSPQRTKPDYRSKIGSLMYLTSSRPYIVQAVCYCARYQARPTEKHLKEMPTSPPGCLDTRKSTSGGIQFLGDKLVSWMSKKQDCTRNVIRTECLNRGGCHSKSMQPRAALQYQAHPILYHFKRNRLKRYNELYFVRTEYQLADMFTKALPEERFQYLVRRIGMRCLTPAELEVLTKESA
ncbi:retrovirus-related pol polyprotein from transposon TNT 1-94 [Tanacetum coccineum]